MSVIIDKYTQKGLKSKKYIYSRDEEAGAETDFLFSNKVASVIFDMAGGGELNVTAGVKNGGPKAITNGYSYANAKGKGDGNVAFTASSINVQGLNVSYIYGGAYLTTRVGGLNAVTKYTGYDTATVTGDVKINVDTSKVSAVFGGGAGYGSVLNGKVAISVSGSSTIAAVYGGGQKGAVVNGDVSITVDRRDAKSGRISAIYGGGYDATVNGNVKVTINGTNALPVGLISGSGRGSKSTVSGKRTLEIADYSGKFTSTIKDFDEIVISGSSAITLTQNQQKSIKSATYTFAIDEESIGQTAAMLTWNKNVNFGQIVITVDTDISDIAENGFTKTIYSSTFATKSIVNNILVKTADGATLSSSVYSLEFVYNDAKSEKRGKGGYVVLKYAGSNISVDGDDTGDQKLTGADDEVTVKGDLVRSNVDVGAGDDSVTVQTGTLMAGDIKLGTGKNRLVVQGDAEVTGSIIVSKESTNTIDLNGTISQIEGGDTTTNNIVTIRTPNAVGYYKNTTTATTKDALGTDQEFIAQDLDFTNSSGSNDTVNVTTASAYTGNINFGEGKDTLVLNSTVHGTITADDGNDVIVANRTGVSIDANTLKLSGTDNIFVVTNGVKAAVTGVALGTFEKKYSGIYLGQNAVVQINGELATQSYDGDLDLDADLTILKAPEASDELKERIGKYYTAGDGVNADIEANGKTITVREGAKLQGKIIGAASVYFKGANDETAGANLRFDNDGAENAATIEVAKGVTATVASVKDIAGTTYRGKTDFENDSAQVTLNENAALYAAEDKNLLVGNVTKDTDFAAVYGDKAKGTISVIDKVEADVTFTDAKIYAGKKAAFDGDITFVGENAMEVATEGLVLDKEQITFADAAAKVEINVNEGAELVVDGIKNGDTYTDSDQFKVTLAENARLAYNNTVEIGSWDAELKSATLDGRTNLKVREGAKISSAIDMSDSTKALNVEIADDVTIKGALTTEDKALITLGKVADTLTVGTATVNGMIDASNDSAADEITLNGSTVNAVNDATAIKLGSNDQLALKAKKVGETDVGAYVNGNITGGKLVDIEGSKVEGDVTGVTEFNATESMVDGAVSANKAYLTNARIYALKASDTYVSKGMANINTIDFSANAVSLTAEADTTTEIANLEGSKNQTLTITARNAGKVTLDKDAVVDVEANSVTLKAVNADSTVALTGDATLIVANAATINATNGANVTTKALTINNGLTITNEKELKSTLNATSSVRLETTGDKSALTVDGDLKINASSSTISLNGANGANSFGSIYQAGTESFDGLVDANNKVNMANSAVVEVTAEGASLTTSSIKQIASSATVTLGEAATLTGNVEQVSTSSATVKTDDTTLSNGKFVKGIKLDGAVTQTVMTTSTTPVLTGSATVNANVTVKVNSNNTTIVAENDNVEVDNVSSIITGDVKQVSRTNTFNGTVALQADGKYETVSGILNTEVHKETYIKAGTVTASYGAIDQYASGNNSWGTNNVTLGLDFDALGESDIKAGAVTLKAGDITQKSTSVGYSSSTVNTIDVDVTATAKTQAVIELNGDMRATLGALSQTAYKNNNKIELTAKTETDQVAEPEAGKAYGEIKGSFKDLEIKAESIDMLSYGGTNTLTLEGNITITGNVNVGGVLSVNDAEQLLGVTNAQWADRTATKNTITVDVDTVTIGGNLSVVGITNVLNLNNETHAENISLAKKIYIAGNSNAITVADGVKTDNIHIYNLVDSDKFGQDGYEIGTGTYTNGIEIKGETGALIVEQENATDVINVVGGIVNGNVATLNNNDKIVLGARYTLSGSTTTATTPTAIAETEVVKGDSKITGNVVMGKEGEASGTNDLQLTSFTATQVVGEDKVVKDFNSEISGSVEQYSDLSNVIKLTGKTAYDAADVKKSATLAKSAIGGAIKQVVTQAATAVTVNGEAQTTYTKVDASIKNEITAVASDVGATVGEGGTVTSSDVVQKMEGSNKNVFTFTDKNGEIKTDKAETGVEDKIVGYAYDNVVGNVKQEGAKNSVTITNAKNVGGIAQTAQAVDGVETTKQSLGSSWIAGQGYVTQYKHTSTLGKVLEDNTIKIGTLDNTGYIIGGSFGTIGAIEQSLTNVAYKEHKSVVTNTSNTAPDPIVFTDEGTDKITVNGNTLQVLGVKTDTYKKAADTSPKSAVDTFNNDGKFVTTIGDVTQTLNGINKDTAATNEILLKDVNTGVLKQVAMGKVTNTISYTGTEIAQYKLNDKNEAVVDETAKVRATIAGIAQEAKILAQEAVVDGNVTTQKNLVAANNVTLEKVNVTGNISATTDTAYDTTTTTDAKGVATEVKDQLVAATAVIGLTDVAVGGGIATGYGDDVIMLKGNTKVAGVVDMKDFANEAKNAPAENDVINVAAKTVDLSAAEISGVENFNVNVSDIQSYAVKTIEADTISYSRTVTGELKNELKAEAITVGKLSNVQVLSAADDATKFDVTFTGAISYVEVNALAESTADTLTVKTGASLDNAEVRGIETVTFEKGATASTNLAWVDTKAESKGEIAFTVDFSGYESFYVGVFNGYDEADITFNGAKYNKSSGHWAETGASTYIKYDAETGKIAEYYETPLAMNVTEVKEGSILTEDTSVNDKLILGADVLGSVKLAGGNDTLSVTEAKAVAVTGDIDLGDGSNELKIGTGATLTTNAVSNIQTIEAADATLNASTVSGVKTIKGGTINAALTGSGTLTLEKTTTLGTVTGYDKIELEADNVLNQTTLNGSAVGIKIVAANDKKADSLTLKGASYGDIDLKGSGEHASSEDKLDTLTVEAIVKTGKIENVEVVDATKGVLTTDDVLGMEAKDLTAKINVFTVDKIGTAEVVSMTGGTLDKLNAAEIKSVTFADVDATGAVSDTGSVTGLKYDTSKKTYEETGKILAKATAETKTVVIKTDADDKIFTVSGDATATIGEGTNKMAFKVADSSVTKKTQIDLATSKTLKVSNGDAIVTNFGGISDIEVADGYTLKSSTGTLMFADDTSILGTVDATVSGASTNTLTLKGEAEITGGVNSFNSIALKKTDDSLAIATIGDSANIDIAGSDAADSLTLKGASYKSVDLGKDKDVLTTTASNVTFVGSLSNIEELNFVNNAVVTSGNVSGVNKLTAGGSFVAATGTVSATDAKDDVASFAGTVVGTFSNFETIELASKSTGTSANWKFGSADSMTFDFDSAAFKVNDVQTFGALQANDGAAMKQADYTKVSLIASVEVEGLDKELTTDLTWQNTGLDNVWTSSAVEGYGFKYDASSKIFTFGALAS